MELLARFASVVGLEMGVRLFPGPTRLRDQAQVALLGRLRQRLGPAWKWRFEEPLPIEGDQRAWDARATHQVTRVTLVVDAESRIRDGQALLRREALKKRDSGEERLVLLVADTRANRAALHDGAIAFTSAFPVSSRAALGHLAKGEDPGGDAIVVR